MRMKELQAAYEQLQVAEEREHSAFYRVGYQSPILAVRDAYSQFRQARAEIAAVGRVEAAEIKRLKADDTIFPQGKQRLVNEAKERANASIASAYKRAQDAAAEIKRHLFDASMPKLNGAREVPTRDEVRMVLDAAPDPVAVMAELAQGDGDSAGLVTSSWGESYLRARGVHDPKAQIRAVRESALRSAADSADPVRRAAVEGYALAGKLPGAILCTKGVADHDLDDALTDRDAVAQG